MIHVRPDTYDLKINYYSLFILLFYLLKEKTFEYHKINICQYSDDKLIGKTMR